MQCVGDVQFVIVEWCGRGFEVGVNIDGWIEIYIDGYWQWFVGGFGFLVKYFDMVVGGKKY